MPPKASKAAPRKPRAAAKKVAPSSSAGSTALAVTRLPHIELPLEATNPNNLNANDLANNSDADTVGSDEEVAAGGVQLQGAFPAKRKRKEKTATLSPEKEIKQDGDEPAERVYTTLVSASSERLQVIVGGGKLQPNQKYETFFGFIEDAMDALLVMEGCTRGLLQRFPGNGIDMANVKIRSGTVIVVSEEGTDVKRWRDGFKWSPSRSFGSFLLYRQVEAGPNDTAEINTQLKYASRRVGSHIAAIEPTFSSKTLKSDTRLAENGLTKRTITLRGSDGLKHRLISYYVAEDVINLSHGKVWSHNGEPFIRPGDDPELKKLKEAAGDDLSRLLANGVNIGASSALIKGAKSGIPSGVTVQELNAVKRMKLHEGVERFRQNQEHKAEQLRAMQGPYPHEGQQHYEEWPGYDDPHYPYPPHMYPNDRMHYYPPRGYPPPGNYPGYEDNGQHEPRESLPLKDQGNAEPPQQTEPAPPGRPPYPRPHPYYQQYPYPPQHPAYRPYPPRPYPHGYPHPLPARERHPDHLKIPPQPQLQQRKQSELPTGDETDQQSKTPNGNQTPQTNPSPPPPSEHEQQTSKSRSQSPIQSQPESAQISPTGSRGVQSHEDSEQHSPVEARHPHYYYPPPPRGYYPYPREGPFPPPPPQHYPYGYPPYPDPYYHEYYEYDGPAPLKEERYSEVAKDQSGVEDSGESGSPTKPKDEGEQSEK
ncbi:Gti1/Pac2 family-domain-containing protein [Obelidium mucronatum]|nr:Gti1/Pac2 family-domain-containing protein [Obelidium mucronatum]